MTHDEDLLGCILAGADPSDLDISPGDFYEPRNEAIFRACLAVADAGRRCDPQSVALALGPDVNRLPGGRVHLAELAETAIPANARAFAAKVRTESERRGLVEIANRILAQSERDPADLLEDARGWLDRPTRVRKTTVTMRDLLPAFIDRVERGGDPGLSTPWPDLDHHLHGLHPGRLYTVGGRPGGGKSVMLTNLAAHFAITHELGVYFATLEMPAQELVGRIVSAQAQVGQTNLLTGRLSEADWEKIRNHHDEMSAMPLEVCDDSTQSLQSIRTGARDMKRRGPLGLVVVDYLQLMAPPDRKLSRQQQIGDLTRGLKRLAKELEVPVVTASQLRRPPDSKAARPTMSDLRESGDIEADSDVIVLLHTPNEAEPWDLEAMVAKNRSGSKGPVRLMFDTTRASMRSSEWRHSA